jgi:uncharacterized protein YfaS (alpha-2-macroglobulin family)
MRRRSYCDKKFSDLLCSYLAIVLMSLNVIPCNYAPAIAADAGSDSDDPKTELSFTVTESQAPVDKVEKIAAAPAQNLSEQRVDELIKRLSPVPPVDKKAFVIPEDSLVKPKLPGITTLEPFPPKDTEPREKPVVNTSQSPLTVLRVSHSGEVNTVTQYAMTFSQPMVPVSEARAFDTIPAVEMKPQPAGKWKWAGSQTVLFDPERGRFPKSTEYTITIPAGTESVTGSRANKAMSWKITTPTPTVQTFFPQQGQPQVQSPVMVAVFDQDIDRAAVLKHTRVTIGNETYSVRLVDDATVAKDLVRNSIIKDVPKNQWIAFQTESPMLLGTTAKVSFQPGLPSLEGPLKTTKAQDYNVTIHGAMKLIQSPEPGSSPERYLYRQFTFSNPIDNSKDKFKESMIKITPEIEGGAEWQVSGQAVWLKGRLKPFTKYTVTFDKNITDTFGQTLERETTASFTTGALNTMLNQLGFLNTIPFGQKPIVQIYAQATPQIKVTVFRTTPRDWLSYAQQRYDRNFRIGTAVGSKLFKIGNEDAQVNFDLTPYLKNGLGQFVLLVETVGVKEGNERRFQSWMQVTKLGVDAFKGRSLVGLVTSLSEGTPLQGVELSLLDSHNTAVTDINGLAKLPLSENWQEAEMLVAKKGEDVAFVPASQYRSGWSYHQRQPEIKWFAVTDRQLYKPGEKVTVKGWTRGLQFMPNDALRLFPAHVDSITYKIDGYDGKELVKGEAKVDATGGFSFETTLPEKINLGVGNLVITAKDSKEKYQFPGSKEMQTVTDYFNSGTISTYVQLKIQEFRRPEFEMKVASSLGTSMLLGDSTALTAKTNYYAGGVLQNAPINWSIKASQTSYSPPGWSEFTFGKNNPIWFRPMLTSHHMRGGFPMGEQVLETRVVNGFTDAAGMNTVNLKFDSLKEPLPISASCEATVSDVNRQSWSDKVAVLVHPADTYLGVKPGRWFYHKGEAVDLKVIATDLDGKVKAGSRAVVKLMRVDRDGKEIEVIRQSFSSGDHPKDVNLMPKEGGQHYIVATVFDGKERRNLTRISTWVEGDTPAEARKAEMQNLILIPDKKEYQPGDTAEVMVSAPFFPAHGLVTIRRDTIVSTMPLDMDTSSKSVKIPITKDYFPNLTVEFYVAGKDAAFASGTVEMKVPPRARTLKLTAIASEKELAPGGDTTINIDLKNNDGKPVKDGQVTLMVADESILALADYKWPDPIDLFYPESPAAIENAYFRQYVIRPMPETSADEAKEGAMVPPPPAVAVSTTAMVGRGAAFGGLASADANMFQLAAKPMRQALGRAKRAEMTAEPEPNTPISVRTNFAALALFVPSISTDENGKAQVKLHLPDSLTRYRIMAAAISGDESFGSTESNVTARLPLMVKPSAPRFLHFGDRCELPVVLQNQTDKPMKVEVLLRADNAQLRDVSRTRNSESRPETFLDSNSKKGSQSTVQSVGKVVEVPANDRVEVRFDVATIDEGKANFQCAAVSGLISDASEFSIPVLVPATMESFAAYGQIDKGAILQKLDRPKDVYEQVGGLSVTTSSTAVQALTDAFFYLKHYTYGCSEQISSRMIAMVSLQDVLIAFGKMDAAAQAEFKEYVKKDIAELIKRQNPDGSFGLWKAGEGDRWPYVSIQVAQALSLARDKDYTVDADVLKKSERFLKDIASHIPAAYSERSKISIEAKALNVRYRLKDSDPSAARRLIKRALKPQTKIDRKDPPIPLAKLASDKVSSDLSLETAGWLLPVICHDKDSAAEIELIRRLFDAGIKETASTASANDGGYGDWGYCIFYSPRRTDAIVLEALMEDQPKSELIPKMVKGLLAHRKNGTWEGTQENGYILQALDKYFAVYESQTPNFESQAWLGETLVGLQKFVGRTTETRVINVPMSYLAERNDGDIVINKVGPGRLYYRIGLDYSPRNLVLKPADFGFTVERTYEAVDNPGDVKKDDNGVWHFKSGATVKAKLKFSTPGARYHVAMMDPLPAGAEPLNPDLSGSRTQVPPDAQSPAPTGRGGISKFFETPFIWWWPRTWFEHQNLRDHQAEAFQSLLFAGKYDYTYMMRATTPGDYIVPPTKVEEMYMSETFGRSGSDHVIIE